MWKKLVTKAEKESSEEESKIKLLLQHRNRFFYFQTSYIERNLEKGGPRDSENVCPNEKLKNLESESLKEYIIAM